MPATKSLNKSRQAAKLSASSNGGANSQSDNGGTDTDSAGATGRETTARVYKVCSVHVSYCGGKRSSSSL